MKGEGEIITEDEAKEKWCPMVRALAQGQHYEWAVAHNDRDAFEETRCIASGCMMWRWAINVPVGVHIGYCGLAGEGT